jgi:transposase
MITVDQSMDIRILHREGLSIRAIAQRTGHARNTVRKVLRGQHSNTFKTPERTSKLEPFHDYLTRRWFEFRLNALRLHQEVAQQGYDGSVDTVRRFIKTLKDQEARSAKATVRFETPPGKQAQVDWAECGRFFDPSIGRDRTLYAFVMTLGYSRMMYVCFTWSMKLADLLTCHEEAFAYFGGCPELILYDNMKQVRISNTKWNAAFIDFAQHYGFTAKTHRPYRPRTKGKVERAVDYLKDGFLAGRSFNGLDDVNAQVMHWLEHTANPRIHGTTAQRPIDRFEQERAALINTQGRPRFVLAEPVSRRVNSESHVHFEGNRYSVPSRHVGQRVRVFALGGFIEVRVGDTVVARHVLATGKGQCVSEPAHLADLWKQAHARTQAPPREAVRWDMDPAPTHTPVQQTPLQAYEELAE